MQILVFLVYGSFVYSIGALLYLLFRFAWSERTPSRFWTILTRPVLAMNAIAFPLGAVVPPLLAATVRGMDGYLRAGEVVAALYCVAGAVSLVLLLNRPKGEDRPHADDGGPPAHAGQMPRKARQARSFRID
ncbi:hypothetical protein [Burkholderia pseudomultivorans]|uniref:Uncharacterized protein n=1 Tax=Burkholderia pseudomultivorans TaxID=1207504 RepID=A0A132F7C3_9BURK|nr:hypothetical protein [Burkholderia pseudomultivorans]KVG62787.1 hypothetical protein WS80_23685 [Burkholderia pseudomultivorans]KWF71603.1 hypothetical protein WT57_07745 [Burkholderia pseudomultivorans]